MGLDMYLYAEKYVGGWNHTADEEKAKTQDRRDTAEELHNRALEKRDRIMDKAPAGTPEPGLPDMPPSTVDVLPRDLDDHPAARDRVNQLAEQYDSVEVDRLPPMGALHWLITAYRADGSVDTFRVGASGSLMPWPVKP
jgi:zona occludens toxin (predicted ATPase)